MINKNTLTLVYDSQISFNQTHPLYRIHGYTTHISRSQFHNANKCNRINYIHHIMCNKHILAFWIDRTRVNNRISPPLSYIIHATSVYKRQFSAWNYVDIYKFFSYKLRVENL